ncbi:mtDNA inheritance, partitioning of the mitochondrial organelle [Ascosphaera atra]|nr:mtDNA inheritance, partitioning of the mitochondrial organelle [Ascosphaera atra]
MRGIQIFTGTDDAWGGFAARYVDRLRDEFGKTSIWLWGSEDGTTQQRQKKVLQSLNCARSINEISPQVNAYIPLTTLPRNLPPWINLHPGSDWYASALLATAVESVTLPTRLKPGAGGGSVDWLPGEDHPQKIYQLQQQIRQENEELPEDRIDGKEDEFMGKDDYEQDEDLSAGFDVNLSPTTSGTNTGHIFGQIRMCRNSGGERRNSELNISIQRPRYTDILKSGAILQKYNTTLLFPLFDSFPDDMFTSSTHKPKALKTRSVLSTTSHTKDQLQELQTLASRGIALDEREALVNGLGEISEAYKHGWEDESDSEDI